MNDPSSSGIFRLENPDATLVDETDDHRVSKRSTLSGFTEELAERQGLALSQLDPFTRLGIRTRNTNYEMTLLDPWEGRMAILGGRYFATLATVVLIGSSFGGSLLKLRWIGSGLRMEIMADDVKVVTSPVQTVEILPSESVPGPF
jgi:hypothetical protein